MKVKDVLHIMGHSKLRSRLANAIQCQRPELLEYDMSLIVQKPRLMANLIMIGVKSVDIFIDEAVSLDPSLEPLVKKIKDTNHRHTPDLKEMVLTSRGVMKTKCSHCGFMIYAQSWKVLPNHEREI